MIGYLFETAITYRKQIETNYKNGFKINQMLKEDMGERKPIKKFNKNLILKDKIKKNNKTILSMWA
jgi:hypothetical protein